MLTVSELLPHPALAGFSLITDESGLNNRVRGCRVFEWQTGEALDEGFHPGDFVITTLTPYRDAPWSIINMMVSSLLEKNIAALAIKNVYFKSLSDECVDIANELHIPIFLFEENNFDDIIYAVKNAITPEELNSLALSRLRTILYEDISPAQCELHAKSINQFFGDNIIAGYFIPRNHENATEILEDFRQRRLADSTKIHLPSRIVYSVLRFTKGIGLLISDTVDMAYLEDDLLESFESLGLNTDEYAFGIGDPRDRLRDVGPAFQEAIYAATSSYLDEVPMRHFKDIGLMRLLCPLRNNEWVNRYYNDNLTRLLEYDRDHDTSLMETLTEFVNCNYNFSETADKLFQHGNTVRYRVKKAMEVLGIGNGPDSHGQIYTLVRLHAIYDLLLHENI